MSGQCPWGCGDRADKFMTCLGKGIDVGRRVPRVTIAGKVVNSHCIQGDQYDIWPHAGRNDVIRLLRKDKGDQPNKDNQKN